MLQVGVKAPVHISVSFQQFWCIDYKLKNSFVRCHLLYADDQSHIISGMTQTKVCIRC